MTKAVSRKSGKNAQTDHSKNAATKKPVKTLQKDQQGASHKWMVLVFLCVLIGAVSLFFSPFLRSSLENAVSSVKNSDQTIDKVKDVENEGKPKQEKDRAGKAKGTKDLPKEFKDFKITVQSKLKMKNIKEDDHKIKIQELKHSNSQSSVHAYVIENFLSDFECDSLVRVHNRYVSELNEKVPIICFDGMKSFRQYLRDAKIKTPISPNDFTEGTTCINETFSAKLQPHFTWSFSTAFYPGESQFSTMFAEKINKVTGLGLQNGGKFQITSYPQNVGYKNHTDCIVGTSEKRDRFATVLVYLKDVEEGGETQFPQLGISVKPRKGLALIWNSMNTKGECDPTSLHNAVKVVKGHKFIIQRWYYYHNFPALGKRPQQPYLPPRQANQPRVSCDEYEQGSCRWYDEWNYDHIVEYNANLQNLV